MKLKSGNNEIYDMILTHSFHILFFIFSLMIFPVFGQEVNMGNETISNLKILEQIYELQSNLQKSSLGSTLISGAGIVVSFIAILIAIMIFNRQREQSEKIQNIISDVHNISTEQANQKKQKREAGELLIIGYLQNFINDLKLLIDEVKLIENGKEIDSKFLELFDNFETRRKLVMEYLDKQSVLFADSLDKETLAGIIDLDNNLKSYVPESFVERPHYVSLKMTVLLLMSIARSLDDEQLKNQLEEKFSEELS